MRLPLAIVVAMNRSRVIGVNGELPWHIPEDLRHFRRVTMGHAILMGRTTHESIGRALPGRTNVVITRQKGVHFEGCQVANSIEEAIEIARSGGDDEPRIIGGGTIYERALEMATKLFITEVDLVVEGDTFFPQIDWSEWTDVASREGDGVVYRTLERR